MNEQQNKLSGEMQFHVDASILVQLGEQLVTRRSTALAELIKNAFDADATEVLVTLQNLKKPRGTITVEDNGQGMTLDEIKSNWMRLATNNKRISTFSSLFKRPRSGQKGIGRFAVRRLADILILETVAYDDDLDAKVKTTVNFDWRTKFKDGQTLTEIPVNFTSEIVSIETPTGVILHLKNAKEVWTADDVAELRRDLSSLVNPFPNVQFDLSNKQRDDPGFQFLLITPEFPEAEGELSENFLTMAWGTLSGQVFQNGRVEYNLSIRPTKEIVKLNPVSETFHTLAGVSFTIYYFVYRSSYFEDDYLGVYDAMRIGREQGGVRIYLDNFRVSPYGEKGDDWLELNESRSRRTSKLVQVDELDEFERQELDRPELLTPGNNQVFGAIKLSQTENPQFQITASREGFVDNETFKQLKRFTQIGIWWLTLQYSRVSYEERFQRREERSGKKHEPISQVFDQVRTNIKESPTIPIEEKQVVITSLDEIERVIVIREEQHMDDLTMLRILSATGTVVSMMNHQLRSMLSGIHSVAVDLEEMRQYVMESALPAYEKMLQRLQLWRKSVEEQVSSLGFILGEKARKELTRPSIKVVVDNVVFPLSLYLKDHGIEVINDIQPNLRPPPMYEAELYAVLLHVFTNALKAVRDQPIRKVQFRSEEKDGDIHIYIYDTGIGIPVSERESVFKPFRTTTGTPDPVFGTGTGLGLKTVRDILNKYHARTQFIDVDAPWKTCLEIILEQ